MSLPDGLHADCALDWSDEETLAGAKVRQDRICSAPSVTAVAYPGEPYVEGEEAAAINPGYMAHVYLIEGQEHAWAGVVWRDDRLPTREEIALALTEWRGDGAPLFIVRWWNERREPTGGSHGMG